MLTYTNLFSDFSKWNKIHYFSFIHRKTYPNLFFFYFSYSGNINDEFTSLDKTIVINLIREFKNKINGSWGFLSLFTNDKNGLELYKHFNKTEYICKNISLMVIQDITPFKEEIKIKIEETFSKFDSFYKDTLRNFETYLSGDIDKKYEFIEFASVERIVIYHTKSSLLKQIKEEKYPYIKDNFYTKEKRTNKNKIIEDIDDEIINERKSKKNDLQSLKMEDEDSFFSESSNYDTIDTMSKKIIFDVSPKVQICKRYLDGYYSDYKYNVYSKTKDGKIKYSSDKEVDSVIGSQILFSKQKYNKNLSIFLHKYKVLDGENAKTMIKKIERKSLNSENKPLKSKKKIVKKRKLREKKFDEDNCFIDDFNDYTYITNRSFLEDEKSIFSNKSIVSSVKNQKQDKFPKRNAFTTLFENNQFNSTKQKKSDISIKEVKSLYANDKNCSITSYFNKITEVNDQLEKNVIKIISKILNNDIFQDLLHLLKENNLSYQMFTQVNTYYASLLNKGNTIDSEIIVLIELTETLYKIDNEIFEFHSDKGSFIETFKKLICFYRFNLKSYLHFYETQSCSEKSKFLISLDNLIKCENLIKILMRRINESEIGQDNMIKNEIIKTIFTDIINIFTFLSNVILFHSDYIDSFCDEVFIRFENFLSIIKALWIKTHEKLNKSLKIHLQILYYQIITKLFSIDFSQLLRGSSKSLKPKYIAFISFLYRIVDVYLYITSNNQTDNGFIEKSIEMINIMFNEFMYPALRFNTQVNISSEDEDVSKIKFNEEFQLLLKDLYNDNFLDKTTFDKSFKSHLYHLFIINITKCYNLDQLSSDIQKFLFDVPFLQLCHRYLNLLSLFLIDTRQKLTNFEFLNNFYSKIDVNDSFYDIESKIYNISNLSTKKILNLEIKKKLYYRYINSDISSIIEIQKRWKIDTLSVCRIVLYILKSFTNSKRKYLDISDYLKKKDLYKLLDFIKTGQEVDDHLILSFIISCVQILNNLISSQSDENSKKRNLSKFSVELQSYKAIFDSQILTETSIKLGLVPTLCVVLSFLKFINLFQNKDSRRHCVKIIVDNLNFEKSTPSLKGFMICIFLKLIQNFDLQNSRDDVKFYIDNYLNPYVKGVISLIKEKEENKNLKEYDQSTLTELYETIHFYLKSLVNISEDTEYMLLIKNKTIIEELREVVSVKNVFPSNYKKMVVIILNNLFEKIHRSSEEIFNDVIMIDDMEINIDIHELSQDEIIFIEKNEVFAKTILVSIFNSYITDKRNSQFYKGKIPYDLANFCCETSAKMLGILYKNKLGNKASFLEVYGTDKTLFSSRIRGILVDNNNFETLSEITTLAFKAYSIFLKYNSKCFIEFINNQEYMSIHHFLIMAFFALFHSYSSERDIYLTVFLEYLLPCKEILESNLNKILFRDLNEKVKAELSYYNILLLIINTKETFELSKTNIFFLKDFIEVILDSLILVRRSTEDLRKIEARHFFNITRNLDEIILRNLYKKDQLYQNSIESILFLIINKFSKNFIYNQLDNESSNFIEKALKIVCDNKKQLLVMRFNDEDRYFIYFVEEILSNDKIDKFKEIVFRVINIIIQILEYNINGFRREIKNICDFPEKLKHFFNENLERTSNFLIKLFNYITDEFIHYNDKLNCELYLYYSYNLLYFFSHHYSEQEYLFFNLSIITKLKLYKIGSVADLSIINIILKTIDFNRINEYKEVFSNIGIMIVYKLLFIIEIISTISRNLRLKEDMIIIRKKLNFFLEYDNKINCLDYNEDIVKRFNQNLLAEEIESLLIITQKLRLFKNDYLNEIFKTSDYILYCIVNQNQENFQIDFNLIKNHIQIDKNDRFMNLYLQNI